MNIPQRFALVAAVTLSPFTQAEMTALDDAALSNMTGQDGISIIQSKDNYADSIVYTDTDEVGSSGPGTISLNDVSFTGSFSIFASDQVKMDIDIDSDGLHIHTASIDAKSIIANTAQSQFNISIGSVKLNSSLQLASNFTISGERGPGDINIDNAGVITMESYGNYNSGSVDVDVIGLGISNLTVWGDTNPFADSAISGDEYAAQAALEDTNVNAGRGHQAWIYTKREIQTVDNVTHAEWDGIYGGGWQSKTIDNALKITKTASPMNISFDVSLASHPVGSLQIMHMEGTGSTTVFGH